MSKILGIFLDELLHQHLTGMNRHVIMDEKIISHTIYKYCPFTVDCWVSNLSIRLHPSRNVEMPSSGSLLGAIIITAMVLLKSLRALPAGIIFWQPFGWFDVYLMISHIPVEIFLTCVSLEYLATILCCYCCKYSSFRCFEPLFSILMNTKSAELTSSRC
jgi:hypothetical protein